MRLAGKFLMSLLLLLTPLLGAAGCDRSSGGASTGEQKLRVCSIGSPLT